MECEIVMKQPGIAFGSNNHIDGVISVVNQDSCTFVVSSHHITNQARLAHFPEGTINSTGRRVLLFVDMQLRRLINCPRTVLLQ